MFTSTQVERLKACVRSQPDYTVENTALENEIAWLQKNSPEKFHTRESLRDRVFFHKPSTNIPMAGYISE